MQNAMTGPDTSLVGGMVAATVLLVLNYLVADLSGANRRFRKFIQGQPSMLDSRWRGHRSAHGERTREHGRTQRAIASTASPTTTRSLSGCSRSMARSASCATTTSIRTAHTHLVRRKGIQKKQ